MLALNLKNKKIEEKVVIPTNVVEYVEEIFNYLRSTEVITFFFFNFNINFSSTYLVKVCLQLWLHG